MKFLLKKIMNYFLTKVYLWIQNFSLIRYEVRVTLKDYQHSSLRDNSSHNNGE